ncbi:MAG: glycosyltransferase family 2 protein, partial [bacterium]
MKLVIQIPAYNEEETLEKTLKDIPDYIEGIDEIEILVVDDGSRDNTPLIAEKFGVKVVSHIKNMGLAAAFATGINNSLEMGADIIVNTDADNQYPGRYIQNLVKPIVEKQADMVIGARPVERIPHFSLLKKLLQKTGSYAVRLVSSVTVPDAPSGFRALSRETAMKINIFSKYTYTLETIIQAGMKDISVKWVPVEVNPPLRRSRLLKSNFSYVLKSIVTIFRMFLLYRPFRFFAFFGSLIFFLGTIY